jgi:hypothetical protein
MSAIHGRPSDARRAALSQEEMGEKGVPLVSNFFPLDRYYDAADRVRLAFAVSFSISYHACMGCGAACVWVLSFVRRQPSLSRGNKRSVTMRWTKNHD